MGLREIPLEKGKPSIGERSSSIHAMYGDGSKVSVKIAAHSDFGILGKKFLEIFFKLREHLFGGVVRVCHTVKKITYSLRNAIKNNKYYALCA